MCSSDKSLITQAAAGIHNIHKQTNHTHTYTHAYTCKHAYTLTNIHTNSFCRQLGAMNDPSPKKNNETKQLFWNATYFGKSQNRNFRRAEQFWQIPSCMASIQLTFRIIMSVTNATQSFQCSISFGTQTPLTKLPIVDRCSPKVCANNLSPTSRKLTTSNRKRLARLDSDQSMHSLTD